MSAYSDSFFSQQVPTSLTSAREVVPLLIDLLSPGSVVDVGCGRGAWLLAFHECGVADLMGIDGPWVTAEDLLPDSIDYLSLDLAQPFELERKFDLALSLEVAEHLPPTSAFTLVSSLVQLAPVVMFSAAVPGQRGSRHVNEQWPSYWADLFRRHHYVVVDAVRPRLWDNDHVAWWYAQNTLLFIDQEAMQRLVLDPRLYSPVILDLAHPKMCAELAKPVRHTSRQLFSLLPGALLATVMNRARALRRYRAEAERDA